MNAVFKQPSAIPQDLLLIQDLVQSLPPSSPRATKTSELLDDDINSSGASDSEQEVVADLLVQDDQPAVAVKRTVPVPDSDSDSDSSDDSSDNEPAGTTKPSADADDDDDDEDDSGGGKKPTNYLATKNETEPAPAVPEIQSVGAEEVLEHIGEIANTMEQAVVVRGVPSEISGRGSDKALDAGTLLVFEDRTVLGFVRSLCQLLGKDSTLIIRDPDLRHIRPHHPTSLPNKIFRRIAPPGRAHARSEESIPRPCAQHVRLP